MKAKTLDTVVLQRDLPEHGLRRGDLGAVVQVYEPEGLEVEFVRASGRTQALVELTFDDVRAIDDEDLISVRRNSRCRRQSRTTSTTLWRRPLPGPCPVELKSSGLCFFCQDSRVRTHAACTPSRICP